MISQAARGRALVVSVRALTVSAYLALAYRLNVDALDWRHFVASWLVLEVAGVAVEMAQWDRLLTMASAEPVTAPTMPLPLTETHDGRAWRKTVNLRGLGGFLGRFGHQWASREGVVLKDTSGLPDLKKPNALGGPILRKADGDHDKMRLLLSNEIPLPRHGVKLTHRKLNQYKLWMGDGRRTEALGAIINDGIGYERQITGNTQTVFLYHASARRFLDSYK